MIRLLITLTLISVFILSCAGIDLQDPKTAAGVGITAKAVADKVIDSAPKFKPYLGLKDGEICFIGSNDDYVTCTLVLGKTTRQIPIERFDCGDCVFIQKDYIIHILSRIETFCKHNESECKIIGGKIEKIYIFD